MEEKGCTDRVFIPKTKLINPVNAKMIFSQIGMNDLEIKKVLDSI